MNAAEKARELVNEKFYQTLPLQLKGVAAYNNSTEMWEYAKRCSLVCVNEMLNTWQAYNGRYEQEIFDAEVKYWQQVKENIHSL